MLVGVGIVCVLLVWLAGRMLYPPSFEWEPPPAPSAIATPTPEPFEPPEPEEPEPPIAGRVRVCCYGIDPYGPGREFVMSGVAARLHAIREDHDLFGRGCPTAEAEAEALSRVLLRPAQVEANTRERLSMADRAQRRLREAFLR
jgi:hypothetical protein